MGYRAWFQCINPECQQQYDLNEVIYNCRTCGELLEVTHDVEALKDKSAAEWKKLFEDRYMRTEWPYGSGVWGKKEWIDVVTPYHGRDNKKVGLVGMKAGGEGFEKIAEKCPNKTCCQTHHCSTCPINCGSNRDMKSVMAKRKEAKKIVAEQKRIEEKYAPLMAKERAKGRGKPPEVRKRHDLNAFSLQRKRDDEIMKVVKRFHKSVMLRMLMKSISDRRYIEQCRT